MRPSIDSVKMPLYMRHVNLSSNVQGLVAMFLLVQTHLQSAVLIQGFREKNGSAKLVYFINQSNNLENMIF